MSDSTIDPFLLDFGTSVNVNEDLRRGIRAEIQELDESIKASVACNNQELQIERQLQADLTHSHEELQNITRGTSDQLENANVHATFLSSLAKTLKTELVLPTGWKSPTSTLCFDGNDNDKQASSEGASFLPGESNDSHSKSPPNMTNQDILKQQAGKLQAMLASMKTKKEELDQHSRKREILLSKTRAIQRTIETEGLEAALEEKRRTVQALQADKDKELARQKALKEAIQLSRDRCGAYAQEYADKTKEAAALQEENTRMAAALAQRKKQEQEILSKRQQEVKEHLAINDKLDEDIANQKAILKAVEDFQKRRDEYQLAMKEHSKKQEALLTETKQVEADLADAQNRLQQRHEELRLAKEAHSKALQFQKENEELDRTVVQPGKETLVKLAQRKEELAAEIGKSDEEKVAASTRTKSEEKAKSDELQALERELLDLREQLEGHRVKKQHYDRTRQESKAMLIADIKQHQDLLHKYENAVAAASTRITNAKKKRSTKHDKILANAEAQSEHDIAAQKRYLDVLQYGARMIEKSKAKQDRAEA